MTVTNDLSIDQISARPLAVISAPVYGGAILYIGVMVCALTASGYLVPAGTANTGPVLGVNSFQVDMTGLSSGDRNANLLQGTFSRPNSATNPVTQAHFGKVVYAEDGQVIGSNPSAGVPAGICDGLTAAGDVVLRIAQPRTTARDPIDLPVPIRTATLAAGTPMAAWADNAGASAPGITLANSKAGGVRWNNLASQTAIYGGLDLPQNIDLTSPVTLKVCCSKVGATAGDLTTFDVGLFPQTVGAAHDAGASAGGTTTACGNPATKVVQEVTLAVDITKLGAAGDPVTYSIKPTDGTLGTDDIIIHSVKLSYLPKI